MKRTVQLGARFFERETASGIVLMAAAAVALAWANAAGDWYSAIWQRRLAIGLAPFAISKPLLLWINDGLMAVFFLLVGLEIKREILAGELASARRAVLPVVAAAGGMLAPAAIYSALNIGGPGARGWGIPMATDIAFALGALALLGNRVAPSLRIFLTAVAIADDLGAVVVIALFYTGDLVVGAFQASALILLVLLIVNRLGVQCVIPYALLGIALWLAVLKSGVHATVAGVLLAFTIPVSHRAPDRRSAPLLQRLEHHLQPWVAFVIMPLFALANAGVRLSGDLVAFLIDPISMGIVLGLVVGKQVGVAASCWLLVRVRLGSLPSRATWRELYGVALLCGIGFTMSLFIATLALADTDHLVAAKIGILTGSIISGTAGYLVLSSGVRKSPRAPPAERYHRPRDRQRSRMRAAVTAVELLARVWRRLAVGDRTPIDVLLDPGFVAIDLETTGLNARRDAIVAVAAIPFAGGRSRPGLVTLVNPGRPIPPQSTAIHGINDAAVATAPPIREVLPRFDAVCTRRIVVGHDVAFDVAILAQARTSYAGLSPRLTLDTRQLARAVGFRDTGLERLAPQLNVSVVGRHTAEGDARMAGEILLALLPLLRRHGARTLGDLLRLQRTAPIED